MLLGFTIKEVHELFTVQDYKFLLREVKDYFQFESDKQGHNILYVFVYYNPELNRGCIDYQYATGLTAYLPDMDLPVPDNYITITFD